MSGTRLKAGFLRGSDGSSLFTGMQDSGLGDVRCSPQVADDGTTRCLPSETVVATRFADNFGDKCAAPLPTYARIEGLDACTAGVRIFHLGAAYTDPVYFDFGAGCEQDLTPPDLLTYYGLGAEVPATGMVELTRMVDGG